MSRAESRRRIIEDPTTGKDMVVNSNGSINVVATIPVVPDTSTAVIIENFADIASTTGTDTIYTITNLKTLTIQFFDAGSEEGSGGSGSVTELFEDPNGDLTVLNRIETIFSSSSSHSVQISEMFVGDGTNRIVIRQRGYSAAAREMFGRWRGFEETT